MSRFSLEFFALTGMVIKKFFHGHIAGIGRFYSQKERILF